ncbi:DUF1905 domain-containing protein [Microbacterium sp. SORGH_AS_0421]|uniref:DUF1905 domain-containing protein n=1 Tax=Microbacterium sp. SORGH_AS_0421 TaxID=3041768 RepID=UPI00278E8D61|nr:DUF1905 domain-containing protein [Microbacterium sp. SORGH_AS_0421]MDQ1175708.1 hypothetical protein [Microbacterium sp. SORGH_AS_0421]
MHLRFTGTIWYWRGPAPFHFVSVPEAEAAMIAEIAPVVTYGWGMIPASVTIGRTTATIALWPKDGGYVVPVKKALQDAEGLAVDDEVEVALDIDA